MISLEQWQQQGRYVEIEGKNFFCIDNGPLDQRPVILLLHGFPTSSWDWEKIWNELGKHYRLLAMDFLGFGFSDKPKEFQYSIMKQADFVEALIKKEVLNRFHVLAHDYGDTVAQELLARQNESGRSEWLSLCLLNGGLFPETHRARPIQKLLLSPLGKLLSNFTNKKQFAKSISATFSKSHQPSDDEINAFWQQIEFNDGKSIFHKLITYMNDRKQHRERWLSALTNAKVPIALINGSVDPVSGAHMVDRYIELLGEPHTLVRLADVGHYPQVESPKEVLEHYLAFIKNL